MANQQMKKAQNVLITGTSSGFGNITAKTLAQEGHQVYATMRDIKGHNSQAAEDLKNWAKQEGKNLEVVDLDVSDEKSVNQAIKNITDKAGKIDIVINNAGTFALGINETFSIDDVEEIYNTNVFGPLRVNNAVLPNMRENGEGLIIQVSSMAGRTVMPFVGVFCSTKWAVDCLAESYHYDLAQLGIESVIVEPGAFPTQLLAHDHQLSNDEIGNKYGRVKEIFDEYQDKFKEMVEGHRPQDPQEVADAIRDLINMPAGERPLRTVVDHNKKFVEEMNENLRKIDENYLKMFKVEDLNKVKKKAS